MAKPVPDPLDQSPYLLRQFLGDRHVSDISCSNPASLGGHIAHAIGDCDRFVVVDCCQRIVMQYAAHGTIRDRGRPRKARKDNEQA